jgi:serine/threonine protein kinase
MDRQRIHTYRILGELGKGGMAKVYHGLHEPLQREVALKVLLPKNRQDKEFQSRFRREALALALCRHQNIASVYDLLEDGDQSVLVLEYVDGPALLELIKDGPVPVDVAAVIGACVAGALDHIHSHQIIHRDIKPANLMFTKAGDVKLVDFSIAKDMTRLGPLTGPGEAVGSKPYMSPEQWLGGQLDPRTDIFSLGVLLYEALTGMRPFQGNTTDKLAKRICEGVYEPLEDVLPSIPRQLAGVVKRALDVKRERRFPNAAAMQRELDLFLAREVKVAHRILLVKFLYRRDKITKTETLRHLTQADLTLRE